MARRIPGWLLVAATPQDRQRAAEAFSHGTWQLKWPDRESIRAWAKRQGWPPPGLLFDGGFLRKMLESDETFALALAKSGLEVRIPLQHYTVSEEQLEQFDAMYKETEDMGVLGLRPTRWGSLVEELRELRRAIEADVVVEIEGTNYTEVGSFLSWAHRRYHMLEDGYDSWYGDDSS